MLHVIIDTLNPKVNAPKWAAAIAAAVGTALGLSNDDPIVGAVAVLVGAALGWVVQKYATDPK